LQKKINSTRNLTIMVNDPNKFIFLALLMFVGTSAVHCATLSTVNIGKKTYFTLDGDLWFPKMHAYDVNGGGSWEGSTMEQLTRLKNSGYNSIMLSFKSDWVKTGMMEDFFDAAEMLDLKVIVNWNLIWEFTDWLSSHPEKYAFTYLGTCDAGWGKVNLIDPDFRQEIKTRFQKIIEYCEQKSAVIAYQLIDSDFWKLCDDCADLYRGSDRAARWIDVSIFTYNPGVLEHYNQWLQDRGFQPGDLGFTDWNQNFLPWNRLMSKSLEHWLSWKEYRRFGYSLYALKETVDYVRTLTDKPVGTGADGGFGIDWMDQEAAPHTGLDTVVDFVTLFLGWNPPWLDSRRVIAASDYIRDCPVIGFFDVTSGAYVNKPNQPIYPSSQVYTTIPWLSGYLVSSGGKIGATERAITQENWDILTQSMNTVISAGLWHHEPVDPKVGVLISTPDAMKIGMNSSRNLDSHFITFAQKGTSAILQRAGIPYAEVWHPEDISKYDVVISEFTGHQLCLTGCYNSPEPGSIESFIKNGGVFIKGPFPLRSSEPVFINLGDAGDMDSVAEGYLDGAGWTDPATVNDLAGPVTVRYLKSSHSALVHLPFPDMVSPYEFSLTYKDVESNAFEVEALTAGGWRKADMIPTSGVDYWRTLTLLLPPENLYLNPSADRQTIRIISSATKQVPIAMVEWAPLADYFPQTKIYMPAVSIQTPVLQTALPGMSSGSLICETSTLAPNQDFYQPFQPEYIHMQAGDISIATAEGPDSRTGSMVVARQYEKGWAIKMGVPASSVWFARKAQNWQYPGDHDEILEDFVSGLVLWQKPFCRAYQVFSDGKDITKAVECIPVKKHDSGRFGLVLFNHSLEDWNFVLKLSRSYAGINESLIIKDDQIDTEGDWICFPDTLKANHGKVRFFEMTDSTIHEITTIMPAPGITGDYYISPNPTHGPVRIHYNGVQNDAISLQVFNASGKLIYHRNGIHPGREVDISGQPGGLYIFRIKDSDNVRSYKIIKK
jgi:hypothetical protein